jgi:hypothetical protein
MCVIVMIVAEEEVEEERDVRGSTKCLCHHCVGEGACEAKVGNFEDGHA